MMIIPGEPEAVPYYRRSIFLWQLTVEEQQDGPAAALCEEELPRRAGAAQGQRAGVVGTGGKRVQNLCCRAGVHTS